jgi:hypothetical protein
MTAVKAKPTKAVGYVRVSTEGQATEGISLAAQRDRIEAWCKANGYDLLALRVDAGLSGKRADNRPSLQTALRGACTEPGVSLIDYSLSRLARSVKDTLEIAGRLERAGSDLVNLSERIDTTTRRTHGFPDAGRAGRVRTGPLFRADEDSSCAQEAARRVRRPSALWLASGGPVADHALRGAEELGFAPVTAQARHDLPGDSRRAQPQGCCDGQDTCAGARENSTEDSVP